MKKAESGSSRAYIGGPNEEVRKAPSRSVISNLDVEDKRTKAVEEKIALSVVVKSLPNEVFENIMPLLDGPADGGS